MLGVVAWLLEVLVGVDDLAFQALTSFLIVFIHPNKQNVFRDKFLVA